MARRARLGLTGLSIVALVALAPSASVATAAERTSAAPRPTCTIVGTHGNDVIRGTAKDDVICGLGGNDRIYGGGGNDIVYGGRGDDRLHGGPGDDWLYGGPGDDRLFGGRGDDHLFGGAGRDRQSGDAGDDRLYGRPDFDRLIGGSGRNFYSSKPSRRPQPPIADVRVSASFTFDVPPESSVTFTMLRRESCARDLAPFVPRTGSRPYKLDLDLFLVVGGWPTDPCQNQTKHVSHGIRISHRSGWVRTAVVETKADERSRLTSVACTPESASICKVAGNRVTITVHG